jgi:integrase
VTVCTCAARATSTRPKNGHARSVPLPPSVLAVLAAVRRRHPFRTFLAESANRPGQSVHPDNVSAYYRDLAEPRGLPGGLHSVRRYVGTELLNLNGGDLDAAATTLGHRDVETLRRHYVADRGQRIARGLAALAEQLG